MKKALLILAISFGLILPSASRAQSFTMSADTINVTASGSAAIYNWIINLTSSGLTLNWHVTGTNFPSDWLTASAFGICDNVTCYSNNSGQHLWNETTLMGQTFTTAPYGDTTTHGPFDLAMNLSGTTSTGCYWVTINLTQTGLGTSKNITFIVCKWPTSVATPVAANDVKVYPNPATDQAKVEFTLANASEVTMTVADQLGRVVSNVTKNMTAGSNALDINTSTFAAGVYHVSVRTAEGVYTQALTVAK